MSGKKFKEIAEKLGVEVEFEEVEPAKIKLDPRARWKCMFGCESYGMPSCPPNVPDFEECERFVRAYRRAYLFRFKVKSKEDVRRAQEFMLEAELSLKKPFAFATFPGSCTLCDECSGRCSRVRPSLSALCVDASSLAVKDGMVALLFVD